MGGAGVLSSCLIITHISTMGSMKPKAMASTISTRYWSVSANTQVLKAMPAPSPTTRKAA